MKKRKTAEVVAPCVPSALPAAPVARHWCRCGEEVFARPTAGNDWSHVDSQGRGIIDNGPPEGVPAYLAALAEGGLTDATAQEYSSLSAAYGLNVGLFWHAHDASRSEYAQPLLVPECCAAPMRAAPEGWACRVGRTVFPYPVGE